MALPKGADFVGDAGVNPEPKRGPGRPKVSPLNRKEQWSESQRRRRAGRARIETLPDEKTYEAIKWLAEKRGVTIRGIVDEAIAAFLRANGADLPKKLQPPDFPEPSF
jgi:hypothetical protein